MTDDQKNELLYQQDLVWETHSKHEMCLDGLRDLIDEMTNDITREPDEPDNIVAMLKRRVISQLSSLRYTETHITSSKRNVKHRRNKIIDDACDRGEVPDNANILNWTDNFSVETWKKMAALRWDAGNAAGLDTQFQDQKLFLKQLLDLIRVYEQGKLD